MSDDVRVRRIAEGDWDGIVALESEAYSGLGLSEGPAALRSREAASPGTCAVLDVGSRLAGYLLALPYPALTYPDLERTEEPTVPTLPTAPPGDPHLHLHDIVIVAELRRRGLAQRLLRHLVLTARAGGYERISLVAVGGSERFWSARGFAVHPEVPSPAGYGANAVYMSQAVPGGSPPRDEVS